MEHYRARIEEHPGAGRLGRHVNHDPRSLNFLIERKAGAIQSRSWRRRVPILDQGRTSSCTGNAATGALGTAPILSTLRAKRSAGLRLDEDQALRIYAAATALDQWPGVFNYPPASGDDNGSDGLSVAKACQAQGFITSYAHIISIDTAHTAIQSGPFIIGTNWYDSMDHVSSAGEVEITPNASVRGGHEYECLGYSTFAKRWRLANSWGPDWGRKGYFYYSDETFSRLLDEDGDATVLIP